MYGDSTTVRAGHNRYGVMAQVVQLSGGGTMSLRITRSKTAKKFTQSFSRVSVLYGRASAGFSVKAVSDTLKPVPVESKTEGGTTLVTWQFSRPVEKATLSFQGNAESQDIVEKNGSNSASCRSLHANPSSILR